MPKKYVIEATMCDTIRSIPLDKNAAKTMAKETKRKLPKSKVKVKRI